MESPAFVPPWLSGSYHPRWVFTYMNSTSGVNDACIAANAGSEWKCIFAEHTSPHIKTPIFPLQGEYDSWQMCCDAGYETKDAKTDAQVRNSPILSWPRSWANFVAVFSQECMGQLASFGPT